MTTENAKINKMAIAKAIYAEIVGNSEIATPRKAFMQRFVTEGPATKECASAYYQMNKTAAAGGKLYKHHSAKKAKAVAAAEPIARPE